jgi:predicted GNAT family acetyltransferase
MEHTAKPQETTLEHEESDHRGAFFIEAGGKRLASMTYSVAGEKTVIIDHTEVDAALRGTGAGKKLVEAAVAWARREGKRIIPLCPFAKSVFDKTPDYADVLG